MQILEVTPGSLAADAGIVAGDRLIAVNDQKVRDFLDLHLWLGEEHLELTLEHADVYGAPFTVTIERVYGRELGFTFPDARIRICGNDCPFCFVDQLPEGLRKNLYIRDDDYRFSYLYGHFITLTNLKEREFERVIEQQLSPLYVSVHALDPEARAKILVSPRAGEIRQRLEQLIEGGITLHTQIVLVPGVNDGAILEETVFGLAEYYPAIQSVSVVPVGLTAHRGDLPPVATFDRVHAGKAVETVRRWGRAMKRRTGETFCYVADEFLLLAGKPIPPARYYGDFGQRENGIGLVRSFLMFLDAAQPRGADLVERGIRRVWVLTGESFGGVLQGKIEVLRARIPEVEIHVVPIENRLFGRPVTCGGLLGGRDLLHAARGRVAAGDLVLVPDEAINDKGIFLDELSPADLSRELGVPVEGGWDSLLRDVDALPREAPAGYMGAELEVSLS